MKRNFIFFKILCLLVLIFSCRQDYLVESNSKSSTSNARMNRVSFEEMEIFLKENTKNNFPNSLDKKYFDKNDNNYITYIDSTSINKIVYGDITSFTMFINTMNDKEYTFSNLIIKTQNGITEEYIYHYKPEEKWLLDFNSGNKRDYEGILVVTDINGNEFPANQNNISIGGGAQCFMAVDIPCYGSSCPCSDGNGQTIYVKVDCNGGGGGDGGGNGPTGPTGPGGFDPSDGGGGTSGNTQTTTPCQKTKAIFTNTAVKSRYDVLKPLTSASQETGYGFKTVSNGMGGTTTQTNSLSPDTTNPDQMKLGVFPTSFGYIHTHLDKANGKFAVKIFSPADINAFIIFLNNAISNNIPLGNIFAGMLASDPDTRYNIYQIIYTGNGSDIPEEYSKEQIESFTNEYRKFAQRILNENDGILTHVDMQKLFFDLLKRMNVKNVTLAKIEDNPSKIKMINFNNNGIPTEQTCP